MFTIWTFVPSFWVLAKMVWTAFIWVSYSWKPDFIGSVVIADTIFLPASTAELVMLAKAVTPITCNAENLADTVSIPVPRPDISTFLAAEPTSSRPLEAPDRFNFCLSLSSVDILVWTFFSNWALSNLISTTLSSTVLLIS